MNPLLSDRPLTDESLNRRPFGMRTRSDTDDDPRSTLHQDDLGYASEQTPRIASMPSAAPVMTAPT